MNRMPIFWGNRNRHGHHDHHDHDEPTHVTTTRTRVVDAHDGRRGRIRMPIFWGNRNRRGHHDHHDEHTHVTTTRPRVIDAHDGRRGRTVVAVPTGNTYVDATDRDRRHHHHSRRTPSTLHGLWNKFLGTITGNRRRRRRGEREMRRAHDERHALRTAEGVQHVRETGHMNKLRKFRPRRHRKRDRHHHSQDPVVIAQGHGERRRHHKTPWGHFSDRVPPTYHGAHHRLFGFLTGRRDRLARGQAMAIAAEDERRRERRRRREEMRDHGRRFRERGLY